MKKRYSIVPIYASAVAWVIAVNLLRPQDGTGYSLCTAICLIVFVILSKVFPPIRKDAASGGDEQPTSEAEDADGWDALEKASKRYAKQFADKPIAMSLLSLSKNVEDINRAIKSDPIRAENSDIRRFNSIFAMYCADLAEYGICSDIPNPGKNVKNILRLTEERFAALNAISKALVDEVYSGNILSLKAGNDALKPLFAALSSKSDFEID